MGSGTSSFNHGMLRVVDPAPRIGSDRLIAWYGVNPASVSGAAGGSSYDMNAACAWVQYWVEFAKPEDATAYRAYLVAHSDAQRKAEEARAMTVDAQTRATLLEAQLAELSAKKTERGMVITLGDVLFGSDKASLTAGGTRSAQKLADVLQQNPSRNVLVEGFTDSTGAQAYNQQLSERRGMTVREALLQMGIGSERISVRGYGESYPVAANDTAANRQLNRRVEIVLSDEAGKTPQR